MLLAGLLLGLATGLKLTNALYSISFLIAINFLPNSWPDKLRNLMLSILSMALGFSLTAGYWIILMWTKFANPLFPFFNKIFQSPYIETDVNLQDLRFLPRDIWQWLFYPFYFAQEQTLVAELKFKESRFAIAYILIVILLGFILYRYGNKKLTFPVNSLIYTSNLSFLLPFYLTAYFIWLIKFSIYRYLIVLELITPILILLIVAYFYPKRNPVLLVTLGIFVLILATVKPLDWWRIPWSDNYFSIDRQALVQYQDDVIVLWGGEPVGYVVPYFPSNTRFLRITGNFGLSPHTKMSKIAEEIIDKTPESSLYLLEVNFELKELDREKSKQAALELRKLVIDRNNCQPFITAIEKYSICKLGKIST
ncbi:MAG: purine permease [Microcystis aeruginosa F13-15]|nr:purine permease [Microcystis aeruginosa F13-15]